MSSHHDYQNDYKMNERGRSGKQTCVPSWMDESVASDDPEDLSLQSSIYRQPSLSGFSTGYKSKMNRREESYLDNEMLSWMDGSDDDTSTSMQSGVYHSPSPLPWQKKSPKTSVTSATRSTASLTTMDSGSRTTKHSRETNRLSIPMDRESTEKSRATTNSHLKTDDSALFRGPQTRKARETVSSNRASASRRSESDDTFRPLSQEHNPFHHNRDRKPRAKADNAVAYPGLRGPRSHFETVKSLYPSASLIAADHQGISSTPSRSRDNREGKESKNKTKGSPHLEQDTFPDQGTIYARDLPQKKKEERNYSLPFRADSIFYQSKLHEFMRENKASGWKQFKLCNAFLKAQCLNEEDESFHDIFDEMIQIMSSVNHRFKVRRNRNEQIFLFDDPEVQKNFALSQREIPSKRKNGTTVDRPVHTSVQAPPTPPVNTATFVSQRDEVVGSPSKTSKEKSAEDSSQSLIVKLSFVLVILAAVGVGVLVGRATRVSGDKSASAPTTSVTAVPTVYPTVSPIFPPTSMPTIDPFVQYGQMLTGARVALAPNGEVVAVGIADRRDTGHGAENQGYGEVLAFSFDQRSRQWVQMGQTLLGDFPRDGFGSSLAVSRDGQILVVGAFSSSGSAFAAGQVKSFSYNATAKLWFPFGQPLFGEAAKDLFGSSLSLSADGNTLAVGAYRNDEYGDDSGQVRIFQHDGVGWSQLGQTLVGSSRNEYFGKAVSLSNDGLNLAVSAPGNHENGPSAGMVRIMTYNAVRKVWLGLGDVLQGETESDFGEAVALSADGYTLAVGAPYDQKDSPKSGYVQVYQFDTRAYRWYLLGKKVEGVGENDRFGYSLALAGDGLRLAVGASLNDDNGISSGHLRLFGYDEDSGEWSPLGPAIAGEEGDEFGVSVSLSSDGRAIVAGRSVEDGQDAKEITALLYIEGI